MPYKDPEKAREAKRKYVLNNKEKVKKQKNKYLENNAQQRLLHSSKWNAKTRGLEHSITIEDIIIPTHCPYLGVELTNFVGKGRSKTNPSLDRINNEHGYIKGNVRVISDRANGLKTNLTEEELVTFAKGILNLHDN